MGQLAYGLSLTLLHSVWQSALLFFVFFLVNLVATKQLPYTRRNYLYLLLITQWLFSIVTFCIYYYDAGNLYEPFISLASTPLDSNLSFIEMITPWLFCFYLIIVIYKVIYLVFHWNRFKASCPPNLIKPSLDLKLFTLVKANEFGIKRKITLWYSTAISTPVTFGFLKPVILMPVALINQLTMEEAETLIVHELTHIKSNDYLLNFILIISDTIFFFNPFIKIIVGHIKLEREKNCDIQVLNFKYSTLVYAETLLKVARFRPKNLSFLLSAVSRNKQLLNRIKFFTSDSNMKFRSKNYPALSYFLLLTVFCVNYFTITEIKREPTTTNQVYTPLLTPGYNADQVYALLSGKTITKAAPVMEIKMNAIEKDLPALKNNLIKIIPSEKELNDITDQAIENIEFEEDNFVYPVTATEQDCTKEVIVNEEISSGKSITKAYKMIFINGQWIAHPMWMFTESVLKKDSVPSMNDSIIKPFHIIQ